MGRLCRPKLDAAGQVEHLRSKGVKFDKISEEDAIKYLSQHNNYFKLRAYRKNYHQHPDGKLAGEYINLDFAYLQDIAIIDMQFRYLMLQMALDIEHFAKVKLLNALVSSDEDGYSIVSEFIASLGEHLDAFNRELERNEKNPYCGDIIKKYQPTGFPAWAFLEVITFGRFTSFYKFCGKKLDNEEMIDDFHLMHFVKDLRNAAAHSNCILNVLNPNSSDRRTNFKIMEGLSKMGISETTREKRMSNIRIQQAVTLLYTHKRLVTSAGVHTAQAKALQALVCERMRRNIDYYPDGHIRTTFDFLQKVVDNWFDI